MIETVNIFAILLAALSAFVLGGIWYSPKVFGKIWHREAGFVDNGEKGGHSISVYILTFLLSLIAALLFGLSLGHKPTVAYGACAGLIVGFCWVSASFGINYLFASRSLKLFLIDAGYHSLQFVLYGVIIALWN